MHHHDNFVEATMILRLALGIALGMKIAQESLLSWNTIETVGIACGLQMIDTIARWAAEASPSGE